MKISKIYDKYKIMPQLQLHMLRVAGVASIIVDNFDKKLEKDFLISACLLHDMGNIIKFDFDWTKKLYPELFKNKGIVYWKGVKNGFIQKYGNDEHEATYKIIGELGVNKKTTTIIKAFGFSKAQRTHNTKRLDIKIGSYSDHRVSPYGLRSLKEKINDSMIRYSKVIKERGYTNSDKLSSFWIKIEKQIFSHCKIRPEDITEEKVKPLIKDLKNFEITTN